MTVSFRPAVRSNVNLLIGLAAPSGGGKTYTAMRLASGIADGKRFAVIDTENGRASHYADQFAFDVLELREPYTPARYEEAIAAADKAGYPVILVDSMSHEWAGHGGILDMQEAQLKSMGGGDNVKMASWIKPKGEHKKMMNTLLSVRAHLILCFRAEAKIDMIKEGGKTKIVPKQTLTSIDGWIPICEKTVPFELTVSLLMTPDAPGVPKPIKLQQQHRELFPLDKPITEESGRRIAEWARGGVAVTGAQTTGGVSNQAPAAEGAAAGPTISANEAADLHAYCIEHDVPTDRVKEKCGFKSFDLIPEGNGPRVKQWIDNYIAAREDKRRQKETAA